MRRMIFVFAMALGLYSCTDDKPAFVYTKPITQATNDTNSSHADFDPTDIAPLKPDSSGFSTRIETGRLAPGQLVNYAATLKGIPYLYGSTDPKKGLDCSGFITYVFNHFNVAVPRQSVGFTHVNRRINLQDAKTGDLILFTGTDSTIRVVGHMGILLVDPGKQISFLHSTSGKEDGVTETPLNAYYQGRYLRTVRIFPQNDL